MYACDPLAVNGQINLDFDANGVLVGIEVLNASHKLPRELRRKDLRVTHDRRTDAAYIYLARPTASAVATYSCDPHAVNGQINLDFDADGVLVGIEVLNATHKLSKEFLDRAT